MARVSIVSWNLKEAGGKHLSDDCQEYYFDFEAYASHLQEHGKFLVTEHGIFELPE